MAIGAVIAGASALMQLLGPLLGSQEQGVSNVNPYSQDLMNQIQAMMGRVEGEQGRLQQRAETSQAQATAALRGAQQTTGRMRDVSQPGISDWWGTWEQNIPEYQQIALQMSEAATEDLGVSLQDQAAIQSAEAMRQVAGQFGGASFSGAAAKAAGQGAAAPIAQAQAQLMQTKSQLASNTFNQLAGQGMGITSQASQNQFTNAMSSLSQQLQGQLGTAGGFAQQGATFQGAASQQGNILASLMGQKASFGGPQFQTPSYTDSPFGMFAQGAVGGLNTIQSAINQSEITKLLEAMGIGGTT